MTTHSIQNTAQLDELSITETYQDMQSIILYQVYLFMRKFRYLRVTKEELVSLANEVFMEVYRTYDPSLGCKFHTYLSFKVWFGLLQEYAQKDARARKRKMGVINVIDMTELEIKDRDTSFSLTTFMDELTTDASVITMLVLDGPADLAQAMRLDSSKPNGTTCRASLRQYLLGLGWNAQRITDSFKEISLALS